MAADNESNRSRTPKGKASKDRILDMAEKMFALKGFAAAGIGDVVKGLGISAGALYHHFPSKRDLLAGIAERSLTQMGAQMDAWLEDPDLSPSVKVDRFLAAMDDRRRLKRKLSRIDLGTAQDDRDMHEMVLQKGLEPISERLGRIIEQGNATGEFKVTHPKATAVTILLLTFEFVHRSKQLEKLTPIKKLERTLRDTINQMLGRDGA